MEIVEIIKPLMAFGGIGLFFGLSLGYAAKKLKVEVDPKVDQILNVLPGANCGACGEAGCSAFAENLLKGTVGPSACIPGGSTVMSEVSKILGIAAEGPTVSKIACVQCGGSKDKAKDRFTYQGLKDCKAASLVWGGPKACTYGCLGLGTCANICPFSAIVMKNGLAVVLEDKCTGCGKCVDACPRIIIKLIPRTKQVYLNCISQDKGKTVKDVCRVGCIGCGLCVKLTPSKALVLKNNLPQVPDKWEDYETAVNKCPTKSFAVRNKIKEAGKKI